MHQVLLIPNPPSLNKLINASRSNRFEAARLKKQWTENIASLAREQGLERIQTKCWIALNLRYTRTNSDPDNLQAGCFKVGLDGLVLAKVLKGDSVKEVGSPLVTFFSASKNDTSELHLFSDKEVFNYYITKTLMSTI